MDKLTKKIFLGLGCYVAIVVVFSIYKVWYYSREFPLRADSLDDMTALPQVLRKHTYYPHDIPRSYQIWPEDVSQYEIYIDSEVRIYAVAIPEEVTPRYPFYCIILEKAPLFPWYRVSGSSELTTPVNGDPLTFHYKTRLLTFDVDLSTGHLLVTNRKEKFYRLPIISPLWEFRIFSM